MKIDEIQTPAYVCEKSKLRANLALLQSVGERSGAVVLCALKGFAFSLGMPLVKKYLSGATCSGLHEAKFARQMLGAGAQVHTYSPAFQECDMAEILSLSDHVVFNSASQWRKYRAQATSAGVQCGLRLNPQTSFAPKDAYNPCGKFSRLGMTLGALERAISEESGFLEGISGFHFHALCEEGAENLKRVLEAFEAKFNKYFGVIKWLNFGGGHHITREGYNVELLISLIKKFREKYGVEVFLEPGEAVGWECGYLVASVLDIVENDANIAILDTSAEAHMPDTVLMPYRPAVRGESKEGKFIYRFGGNTCLAGDIVGLEAGEPEYKFDKPLQIGDRVIFEDQIHYTIVKNTTFNGIKLPNLVMVDESGNVEDMIEFGYEEFRRRN
ncbi:MULTISPECIES: carboxynorspermidine decarboxylase [unclassified Campylobacter]|uniref:carboxynorspermidine decarboxylase n=1 Tax=unclassified Campylobacter TaxID=2593542 RepID=UPI0022E9EEA6|nr:MULTISPECIES: carboxynorspermidine decarboxylase [unclassified Campylobacter]MDA3054894.1 carboxynorspermidine decarboxylase [Campylobacter sp. VBCF_07 NA4]MDA3060397.1 carboxynorspermidine decarboxylase [Campylobacter sp. VBCF_02 NA5]MDA3070338.1 carboxynorspermidine decarboxylase [Campylobacter sp. VBCF_08 NA3]WBR54765.1 carboxynorspermidine decarboxylase [Campylobacter sp. VBCF_01 NA2]